MSFGDDTLDPTNVEDHLIDEFIFQVGKFLHESGEEFRLGHVELMDAFNAVTQYKKRTKTRRTNG